jgi:hypothetical protein
MSKFTDGWRAALGVREFRDQSLVAIIALLVFLVLLNFLLGFVETRSGTLLDDPILPLFAPSDLRWITYSLIYASFLLGAVALILRPYSLLVALRAFALLLILRMVCIYLVPLNPPADNIPLVDPFIHLPGIRPVLSRDLFFSGQAANIALLAYCMWWRDLRIILAVGVFAISVLLLIQHIHYTIDLVAAPCFAYVAHGLAKKATMREFPGQMVWYE